MVLKEPFSGCRVLIVEDELLIALELKRTLENLGCDVLGPASSIEKALALLETERPDLAFLDEDVKGKPVTPVAKNLRRLQIPFAILSGYDRSITGEAVLVEAIRLQKPTPISAIRQTLTELCAQLER
jgi:two-component system, response regulator PdtaR